MNCPFKPGDIVLSVCVVLLWKPEDRWESFPGILTPELQDDRGGESQGDSEKLTEDVTMRCHFNDFNTRAALQ